MSGKIRKNILKKKKKRAQKVKTSRKGSISNFSTEQLIQVGLQYHKTGDFKRAEHIYRQILSEKPNHAEANHFLGIIAYQVNRYQDAVQLIEKSILSDADSAEAHSNLGNAYKELGAFDKAIASYKKALALTPDYAVAYNNMGNALKGAGRINEAIASYGRALAIKPDYAMAHNNLGNALKVADRMDEALLTIKKSLSLSPDNAKAHNNLGIILKELGQMDEAVVCYRKALAVDSDYAVAWKNISEIVKFKEYDADLRAMEELYAKENLDGDQRTALLFALGKAFEDIDQFGQSFSYIKEGNRLKRASYNYTNEKDKDFFKRVKRSFSEDFFSSHGHSGVEDKTPFFIVGMPRSGTTLVEQILSSHPQVFGAGELKDLSRVCQADRWATMTDEEYGAYIGSLNDTRIKEFGSGYITCLRTYSPDAKHITDKMPHNFFLVGLIKAILPQAKIIHCRRDPMDNCFSIFKHLFSEKGTHKYGYDLKELGQYYTLYRDLMDHWEKVTPDFMYQIRYEEMVSDQQEQTRKLLKFCELPWDESCLSFHKTERKVVTASGAQVRKPIYSDSVRLWKRYEMQLEPLRHALFD